MACGDQTEENWLHVTLCCVIETETTTSYTYVPTLPLPDALPIFPEALTGPLELFLPARCTQPRHLRHFRIVPRIQFDDGAASGQTVLSLVCTERPGLLADIAHVLRKRRLRVHDARIATFGERAEDESRITHPAKTPFAKDRRRPIPNHPTSTSHGKRI